MRWHLPGIVAVLSVLCGCASAPGGGPPASASPDYPAGYSDGCATAGAQGSQIPERPRHNGALAEQSEGYRAGWKAGYGACGGYLKDDPLHHR